MRRVDLEVIEKPDGVVRHVVKGVGRVAGITGAIFGVPIAAVLWAMLRQMIDSSRYGQLALERYTAAEEERRRAEAAGEVRPQTGSRIRRGVRRLFARQHLGG